MANYYTKFSVAFSLPSAEAQAYAIRLHRQWLDDDKGQLPEPLNDEGLSPSFSCEPDGSDSPGLWLWQDDGESCGVGSAIAFIQHLLKKFIPVDQQDKWQIGLEWSNDCSRPRTDAFGGGAAIITAKTVKTMNTSEWLLTETV